MKKDTESAREWPQGPNQPRLTGRAERVVNPGASCAELAILTHAQAVWAIEQRPDCIDMAVAALQRVSQRDSSAINDLAAALDLRAQREDRPTDYLHAWEELSHAPARPEVSFNRALIEKALQLQPPSRPDDAMELWARNAMPLSRALKAGDGATVARLIAPFPYAAERQYEDALYTKLEEPERSRLSQAVSHLTGERCEMAAAAALVAPLQRAAELLKSPAAGTAPRAAAQLEPIEREARARGCVRIAIRALVTHATALLFEARFMESLNEFDQAIAEYESLHDLDAVTDTRMRRISALRGLGQYELAWREALAVLRDSWRMSRVQSRTALVNDVSTTVLQAGFPAVALRYSDAAVDFHRRALAHEPANSADATMTRGALAGALNSRATIEAAMDRAAPAAADLAEAIRLGANVDASTRLLLAGRNEAARGELALHNHAPAAAIAAFSNAIKLTRPDLTTIVAALYAQRAEARFALGQRDDAERDLKLALETVHQEESAAVKVPGVVTDYWSGYFSRFEGSVRRLVGDLVDRNRSADAFLYAERARTFEPLSRVLQPAEIDAIGLPQIQRELPPDTLLLEYCVLENRTIVWIVSHDAVLQQAIGVRRAQLDDWSRDLREASSNAEAALNAASAELLAPTLPLVGNGIKRLVIVPDGPMHALPFAALHNRRTGHYLIEDYALATAGSARLYVVCQRRDRQLAATAGARALLIGDPAIDGNLSLAHGLSPLRHAREEVAQIAPLYDDARTLTGADATVARFFAEAPASAVIHIAAHAIPNAAQPSHSLIVLAPSAHDPGALDAERLLNNLTLKNTRLVVLSACSSAGGLPIGPEGVAPLVRPLIAAGVPAVVGSLWDVNDATAEALLVSFHRHYGQGLDAAAAMQAAQIEMIRDTKNPGFHQPLAWAAFQVIGTSSSPNAAARR